MCQILGELVPEEATAADEMEEISGESIVECNFLIAMMLISIPHGKLDKFDKFDAPRPTGFDVPVVNSSDLHVETGGTSEIRCSKESPRLGDQCSPALSPYYGVVVGGKRHSSRLVRKTPLSHLGQCLCVTFRCRVLILERAIFLCDVTEQVRLDTRDFHPWSFASDRWSTCCNRQ